MPLWIHISIWIILSIWGIAEVLWFIEACRSNRAYSKGGFKWSLAYCVLFIFWVCWHIWG